MEKGQPSDNLFITGLPSDFDEARLREIIGAYGNITTCRLLPPNPMKSGSACMVRFAAIDEAKWIVENLNGNIPQGLTDPVEVKFAVSRDQMKGKDGGKGFGKDFGKDGWGPYGKDGGKGEMGFGKGKGKDDMGKGKKGKCSVRTLLDGLCTAGALPGGQKYENDENTLFVGGLPYDTTDCDLYKMFSPFGGIAPKGVRAMVDRDTGLCKGIGFVNFMDYSVAQMAIATLNGTTMPDGGALVVSTKREGGGPKGGDGKGFGKDGKDFGGKGWDFGGK